MRRKQILVVDDEPIVGQTIEITLRPDGHLIEVVTSPLEALTRFEVGKYDVILTDFRMNEMTGLEMAAQIKSQDPSQPIMLVSGSPPFPPTTVVDVIMLKPFSAQALRKAVSSLAAAGLKSRSGED